MGRKRPAWVTMVAWPLREAAPTPGHPSPPELAGSAWGGGSQCTAQGSAWMTVLTDGSPRQTLVAVPMGAASGPHGPDPRAAKLQGVGGQSRRRPASQRRADRPRGLGSSAAGADPNLGGTPPVPRKEGPGWDPQPLAASPPASSGLDLVRPSSCCSPGVLRPCTSLCAPTEPPAPSVPHLLPGSPAVPA